MTRFLSWIGWSAAGCALLAAFVVAHALIRPHRHAPPPNVALRSGATFASLEDGGPPHLVVTSLQTGGAGQAAGLRVGDDIEDVDGRPAPTIEAFNRDVASSAVDDVDLRVRRGTVEFDVHMKRASRG